jgi:alpha-1,2-mannosyltransferase
LKTRTIALLATLVWIASGGYMAFLASRWQLDLRVYRDAAQFLIHGGDAMKASFTSHGLNFTYSPFALLLFTLLGFGPFGLVEAVWWLVNATALVLTLYFLIDADNRAKSMILNVREQRESRRRSVAIAALIAGFATLVLEPARSDIDYGQINFLLMLLVVVGITSRRAILRGSLVGLAAAIKLTPLVYLGGFLRSDRRSLIRGLGVFTLLAAVSWAVLPTESSEFWLHDLFDASRTGGRLARAQPYHRDRGPLHCQSCARVAPILRSCDGSGPDGVARQPGVLDSPLVVVGDRSARDCLASEQSPNRVVDVGRPVGGGDDCTVLVVRLDRTLHRPGV